MSVLESEKPSRRERRSNQLQENASPVSNRFTDKTVSRESPPSTIRKRYLRKSVSCEETELKASEKTVVIE